jgi:hypothetical protein
MAGAWRGSGMPRRYSGTMAACAAWSPLMYSCKDPTPHAPPGQRECAYNAAGVSNTAGGKSSQRAQDARSTITPKPGPPVSGA